jgi:RimJ/RimL family protein N-acetyltransferase
MRFACRGELAPCIRPLVSSVWSWLGPLSPLFFLLLNQIEAITCTRRTFEASVHQLFPSIQPAADCVRPDKASLGSSMETMSSLQQALPPLHIFLKQEEFESQGITPWFSYSVTQPQRPLPTLSDRPHIKTQRLIVRPLTEDDLDAFHELRSIPELQLRSKTRGRPSKDKQETKAHIDALMQDEQSHWYFGAFLQSTNELIGEGGMPDCLHMITSASGWPEAEFFIKPEYWRQGYGTELFNAVIDSWWELPRQRKKQQLIPALAPGMEAGDDVWEAVALLWEHPDDVAQGFFAKVLERAPVFAEGGFESIDTRQGREGNVVSWLGSLVNNPMPQEHKIEE